MAACEVWPVAIRYVNNDGSVNMQMAYSGETSLVESMQAVLRVKKPVVELHFLAPISTLGKNRRELTEQAYTAIKTTLSL